jgi:nitrite reductase/ring-hydroxylating ferredoxin subunit
MTSSPAAQHHAALKYEALNLKSLVATLSSNGFRFRQFECISEGEYSPRDAEWNYMDVPHLRYVHKQVDGWATFLADTVSASVFLQKVPLFCLPLTVTQYKTSPNSITYYTSFSFYLVIVETAWSEIASGRTRVTTTYAVGWIGRILGVGYPLIRWLLTRNYRILMSEDLPMREQRGMLRSKGYGFVFPEDGPSFLYSKKIMEQNVVVPDQNVIAPPAVPRWNDVTLGLADVQDGGVVTIGEANHVGLSVLRTGDVLQFFPRLCPHEGANLDGEVRACGSAEGRADSSCVIQCPWHGRKFSPILSVRLPVENANYETEWHAFAVAADTVRISCKPADGERLRHSDWSRAATRVSER